MRLNCVTQLLMALLRCERKWGLASCDHPPALLLHRHPHQKDAATGVTGYADPITTVAGSVMALSSQFITINSVVP